MLLMLCDLGIPHRTKAIVAEINQAALHHLFATMTKLFHVLDEPTIQKVKRYLDTTGYASSEIGL